MRCVRCGEPLIEGIDNTARKSHRLPPCCKKHVWVVSQEADKHYSVWPTGWYGSYIWNGWQWDDTTPYRKIGDKR